MCRCTNKIKAPFCGRWRCHWPSPSKNIYKSLFPHFKAKLPDILITNVTFDRPKEYGFIDTIRIRLGMIEWKAPERLVFVFYRPKHPLGGLGIIIPDRIVWVHDEATLIKDIKAALEAQQ
jgi:hypothetical protein